MKSLTKHQQDIAYMLRNGVKDYEIARRLKIDKRVVDRVKEKLSKPKSNRTNYSHFAPSSWCKR